MKMRIIAVGLGLLCGLTSISCVSNQNTAVMNTDPLVSPTLIAEAGWTKNWQINLSLQGSGKIDRIGVLGPDLYVMTNQNIFYLINRQTGLVRYSRRLSTAQLPVQRPFLYDEKLWFLVGNELLVFDPKVGSLTTETRFKQFAVSSNYAFSRNTKNLYVGGADNRLHVLNTDGYWRQFSATADNDSAIVSIQATDQVVVFATQAGNVVGMHPDKAEKLWQYDTTGRIRGQLVQDGSDIYVGSYDSKLYRINLNSGRLLWNKPFHSGAPIRDSFVVGKNLVYLYSGINGVYGVKKDTGEAVWQVPSGRTLLAETTDKAFVYVEPGLLKVMDNTNGEELYSMNLSEVQLYAVNTTDPVMYIADKTGRLMSISVN